MSALKHNIFHTLKFLTTSELKEFVWLAQFTVANADKGTTFSARVPALILFTYSDGDVAGEGLSELAHCNHCQPEKA